MSSKAAYVRESWSYRVAAPHRILFNLFRKKRGGAFHTLLPYLSDGAGARRLDRLSPTRSPASPHPHPHYPVRRTRQPTACACSLVATRRPPARNREGLHPYHFTRVQELHPHDYARRLTFCNWLREERRNILWTDESRFTRVGMFNIHNAHYWTEVNPRVVRPDHFQTRFSVNVWAGILGNRILGPVFLDRLNGDTYLRLLRTRVRRMLEGIPLEEIRGLHFQHDGAPPHFANSLRAFLNGVWYGGERWIGRGGPVPWPPRSPDLTPLDFFLWGRVKDLVYSQTGHDIRSAEELKRRIRRAFRRVKSETDTLNKVKRQVRKRAFVCVQREGGLVQQFCR
ncbi:uncharacterized protein LOC135119012 [Helicoverpa armigera]|uniref:uncharacterized protein LOC135119012 n=1 Tax=Helicoverpa armigera TaxID=29058 RepID=UPI00308271F0